MRFCVTVPFVVVSSLLGGVVTEDVPRDASKMMCTKSTMDHATASMLEQGPVVNMKCHRTSQIAGRQAGAKPMPPKMGASQPVASQCGASKSAVPSTQSSCGSTTDNMVLVDDNSFLLDTKNIEIVKLTQDEAERMLPSTAGFEASGCMKPKPNKRASCGPMEPKQRPCDHKKVESRPCKKKLVQPKPAENAKHCHKKADEDNQQKKVVPQKSCSLKAAESKEVESKPAKKVEATCKKNEPKEKLDCPKEEHEHGHVEQSKKADDKDKECGLSFVEDEAGCGLENKAAPSKKTKAGDKGESCDKDVDSHHAKDAKPQHSKDADAVDGLKKKTDEDIKGMLQHLISKAK